MRVFAGECRKIWGNRQFWIGLFLLISITLFSTWTDVRSQLGEEDKETLTAAYDQVEGMTPEEAAARIGFDLTDSETIEQFLDGGETWYEGEIQWPASLIRRIERLGSIPDYIEETIREARQKTTIGIFMTTGFEKENLEKTREVYENLREMRIPVENHTAVEILLSSQVTDLLGMLFALMLLGILISQERESGVLRLYTSCRKGRNNLACAKWLAVCLYTIGAYCLCLICRYGLAVWMAGGGKLDAPLQCLDGYEHSGSTLTIWRYLFLWLGAKAFYLIVAVTQYFILIHLIRTVSVSMVAAGGIWLLESFLYRIVSPVSKWHILKYLTPESLRSIEDCFQTYRNVEFFGRAIPRLAVVWTAALFWGLAFFFLSLYLFCQEADGRLGNFYLDQWGKERLKSWAAKLHTGKKQTIRKNTGKKHEKKSERRARRRRNRPESVIRHETYKLYISCGGLAIIVISLLFQWYVRGYQLTASYNYSESIYKNTIDSLSGPLTQETMEKEEVLRAYYESNAETFQVPLQILQYRVEPFLEYLTALQEEGKEVTVFYDTPWKKYLGTTLSSQDVQDTFVLMIVLILICSAQVCMDHRHGETAFLYATRGGKRQMFRSRCRTAAAMTALLLVLYDGPPLAEAVIHGGTEAFNLPVCEIQGYGFLPDFVTIGAYAIGLNLWRYLVCLILIRLIYEIAEKVQQYTMVVFICLLVFSLSFLGYFLGSSEMAAFGMMPYLNGNQMIQSGGKACLWYLIIGSILTAMIRWYYKRHILA